MITITEVRLKKMIRISAELGKQEGHLVSLKLHQDELVSIQDTCIFSNQQSINHIANKIEVNKSHQIQVAEAIDGLMTNLNFITDKVMEKAIN